MLVYRWELPCFSEYKLQLSVNDSPSCKYLLPMWLSWYSVLKLQQMFTSEFSSLIVFITSSLLKQIFKQQHIIKGPGGFVCENVINPDLSNPFFQSWKHSYVSLLKIYKEKLTCLFGPHFQPGTLSPLKKGKSMLSSLTGQSLGFWNLVSHGLSLEKHR